MPKPALDGDDDSIDQNTVRPNFFQTLRIPLRRGRFLEESDREGAQPVAVVNEAAAAKHFPGEDAVGQRIVINSQERVIVGVVGDIRHLGLESPARQAVSFHAAKRHRSEATS